MSKRVLEPKDLNDTASSFLWRIMAIIVFSLWMTVFILHLHFYSDLPQAAAHRPPGTMNFWIFVVLGIVTAFCLVVLLVYPKKFVIWGALSCFWGLRQLYDGGDLPGFIMYCLGVAFFYKLNFFKRFLLVKIIIAVILPLAAIGAQFRYEFFMPLITFFRCFFLYRYAGFSRCYLCQEYYTVFLTR
jgi:hypothetical protein